MEKKIWLSCPHMGGEEQKFIQDAFDANWIAPLGPNVNGFEKDLELYLDNGVYVAALSAGTAAIHLGMILLGVAKDDEVICQSMTFSASANPILYQGAVPVFVDSEKDTWSMCPVALEEAIKDRIAKGNKPKAIVAVHLYGMPYKSKEIMEVAKRYAIPVLEDAAEALGSSYHGVKCGTLGDIAILSFNGNKIITTSGGGALVIKDAKLKEKAVFYATQARDLAPHYQHSHIGYNYRMSNIVAGIGRGQMMVLDDRVAARRKNYEFYFNKLHNLPGFMFLNEPEGSMSNRWLSAFVLNNKEIDISTSQIIEALEKENIESRSLWKPMHLQPIFEEYPYYGGTIAEDLFLNGICLPSGSNLTQEDLNRVVACIQNVVSSPKKLQFR